MKAVILAGGFGTRLSEETLLRPKPMVEIGGKPMLWHIMKIYSHHGINDFVVCLGYRGYVVKEYFANYFLHTSNVTIDLRRNHVQVHQSTSEDWRVTLVDTGDETETGGRLARVRQHVDGETFCFTYGDGLSDVDVAKVMPFHRAQGTCATLTAVQPPGRFGAIDFDGERIRAFHEKPRGDGGMINGGFFVLSPKVLDLIDSDDTAWENAPLVRLASMRQIMAFEHRGFWQAMDTLRDKNTLEELWESGKAPWKSWH